MKSFQLLIFLTFLCFQAMGNLSAASMFKKEDRLGLNHESELGMIITDGNTNNRTINFKQTTAYSWLEKLLRFKNSYLYGTVDGELSDRKWDFFLRFEQKVKSSKLSYYIGTGLESDQFSGYNLRYNGEIGAKYFILDEEKTKLIQELGYRYEFERKVEGVIPNSQKNNFGRLYLDLKHKLNRGIIANIDVEWLHDFSHRKNFRVTSVPNITVIILEHLGFKISYEGKYENQPAKKGNKKYDSTLMTSLVANF